MINDKNQTLASGDESINYQASGNIEVNNGLTIEAALQIAESLFRNNFIKLQDIARDTASQRATEITENVFNKLVKTNPKLLDSFQNPDMLNALYLVQKGYALLGDRDVADLLVEILVERANENERNLRQIILDESLEVVSKLTIQQVDILTIIFATKYLIENDVDSLEALKKGLENSVQPFIDNLTENKITYEHLEHFRCGIMPGFGESGVNFKNIILAKYKGLFCKGTSQEEVEQNYTYLLEFPNFIISCHHDNTKLQINALNEDTLKIKAQEQAISEESIQKLLIFFNSNLMSPKEVKDYLQNQGNFMEKIIHAWDYSDIRHMKLTKVGIAIAQANYKRRGCQEFCAFEFSFSPGISILPSKSIAI